MTFARTLIALGVLAIAAAPSLSQAAGLTITDNGSAISWDAHSDNFSDTMTIDGTSYGNYVDTSGTQASSSVFTAVFSGTNSTGYNGGYDTATDPAGTGPFVPENYYFEDAVGDIVASLIWSNDGADDTATYTDYAAGAGSAPGSLPQDGTAVALNTSAPIGYYGFGGSAELVVNTPEPASMAVLGTGLALFGWVRRRR